MDMNQFMSLFRQENIVSLMNTVKSQVQTLMSQPAYVVGLLVAVLVLTQFLGNILATPFGIGVIIGFVVAMYLVSNYINSSKHTKDSKDSKDSKKVQ